ncbi:MAG TPA: hypothetical protein PLS26_11385 [Bacteroidales bacterium]|jgi:hypothetical protein|nr:hypothetical protein [Bacteroidales bacterium]HPI31118.1 hypothetical protein [Bacteroidales bacterium]
MAKKVKTRYCKIQLNGSMLTKREAIEKVTEIINSMAEGTIIDDLTINGRIYLKKP